MSTSSHFMIPLSVAASRPRPAPARATIPDPRDQAAVDWAELDAARRRASLLALLAIYAAGLGLVVILYEGEDIGVVLSAFFAHALYMAIRGIVAAIRAREIPTRLGTLVVQSRARLVPAAATLRT